MKNPTVLIIVVNWNAKDDLSECLVSMKEMTYPKDKHKVLVVDNASTDGSCEVVSEIYPEALLLKNSKNIGYVRAVNQGIEYALKEGFDYAWICNNDIVVSKDALEKMVETGEEDEKIGIIAPLIYSYADPSEVDNAGYVMNLWTGRMKRLQYKKDVFKDNETRIEDITTILGCSNLIKSSVFKQIGQFRKIYELYFEETDFNYRAKQKGFRVVVVREARVRHKKAATMDKFIFRRAYLLLRNLFFFELLNARLKHLLVFIPYYFLIHVPYFIIRGSIYALKIKLTSVKEKNFNNNKLYMGKTSQRIKWRI